MLVKILSIVSILIALYLLFIFLFKQGPSLSNVSSFITTTEYHMGCYSEQNVVNHASNIRTLIANLQEQNSIYSLTNQAFALTQHKNFNQITISVAKDFQQFLSEYYEIKTKTSNQQNYMNSLKIAKQQYHSCIYRLKNFDQNDCQNKWLKYSQSDKQYQSIKQKLDKLISIKQSQQKNLTKLLLNSTQTPNNDIQQINQINKKIKKNQLQITDNKRKIIQLRQKKQNTLSYIQSNKTKKQQISVKLKKCQQNKQIITTCIQLTDKIKVIKLNQNKINLQQRIQRKQTILSNLKTVLKNAQKINDTTAIQSNKRQIQAVKVEIKQLDLKITQFINQQSYCFECSQQKVTQYHKQHQKYLQTIKNLQQQIQSITAKNQSLFQNIQSLQLNITQLQNQKDQIIDQKHCLTAECQKERSQKIKIEKQKLAQIKKTIIQYKIKLQEYKQKHNYRIEQLQRKINQVNIIADCLNTKKYYTELKKNSPINDENYILKIEGSKQKLIKELEKISFN